MGQYPHIVVLLESDLFRLFEFRCGGRPRTTEEEAAKFPEIVMPLEGAYIRSDRSGAVYLDRTVVGFFEAGRPYRIEHLEERPDRTAVVSLRRTGRILQGLGGRPAAGVLFGRSAIRASPELHLRKQEMLKAARGPDPLKAEESVVRFVSAAIAASCRRPDLAYPESPKGATAEAVLTPVIEYIGANFKERLRLSDIAAYAGYSEFYLCRVFAARMKTSIYQYIKALRLEAAHAALENSRLSLTEIALDHGFSSHAHFAAQFADAYGVPPSTLRRTSSARI